MFQVDKWRHKFLLAVRWTCQVSLDKVLLTLDASFGLAMYYLLKKIKKLIEIDCGESGMIIIARWWSPIIAKGSFEAQDMLKLSLL